jgi:hypothetical protein
MWLALTRAKHICNNYFSEDIFKNIFPGARISEQRPDRFLPAIANKMPLRNNWQGPAAEKNLNPSAR